MARRKIKTRVKSIAKTRAKSAVGLTPKRSAKSYAKYELKQEVRRLTVNQLEFIHTTQLLERRIKRYAKKIGLVLNPEDILSMLPNMPKKITKKYLSKLVATTAKELLEAYMPELKLAEPLMDVVVDTVVNESQKTPLEKSTLPENETNEEYTPVADITDMILFWIASLPDAIPCHTKREGFYYIDLMPYKNVFLSTMNDNIGQYEEEYLAFLDANQAELEANINHIYVVSTQQDLIETCERIYSILAYNHQTTEGQSMVSELTELISGWS